MAIQPVQINTDKQPVLKQKTAVKPYIEATGTVTTDGLVKPLPPKGHLVDDTLLSSIKFFFKDIAYDMKSVKEGIKGTANDHKLGRLNDVGLTLGGISIAAYLASRTKNPKLRLMEYIGLGTFLSTMTIYPKLFINTPARLLHGYDIDKEYIDDQGRKKSVMQDSNYVPYDMYLDATKEEDLEAIGDKMGIPRDIKNRNDITKEQMRKIAIQNNTLWMITAGVIPAMTALICSGLEKYAISPAVEKLNNNYFNKKIGHALELTGSMDIDINNIQNNNLSKKVENILKAYKEKELPEKEFNQLIEILTENMDENASEGIKADIEKLLKTAASGNGTKSIYINNTTISDITTSASKALPRNNAEIKKTLLPTEAELTNAIKKICPDANFSDGFTISADKLPELKEEIGNLLDAKLLKLNGLSEDVLALYRNKLLENIEKNISAKQSIFLSKDGYEKISSLAKVLGEFKNNQILLDKCKSFKFEYAQDTIIARYYNKFEEAFINSLGLTSKELSLMKDSSENAEKILNKKLAELCKDEARYKKVIDKFGKIISEMEVKLNGTDAEKSNIVDLITAIENNYNNTAKRLANIDLTTFKETINRLVKEDIGTLKNSVTTKKELFDLLDGLQENKYNGKTFWQLTNEEKAEFIKYNQNGVGSSKMLEIGRILERYQGAKNSFHRVLHLFEVYRRALNPETFAKNLDGKENAYTENVIDFIKKTVMSATSSDHNLKLNTINNPEFYKDVILAGWQQEDALAVNPIKQKGYTTEIAKEALGNNKNTLSNGNVLERFQWYITRFKNIIANSGVDFTKPNHIIDQNIRNAYTASERTRMSFFNLIGQSPLDMAKSAAKRKNANQKWLKIMGTITASFVGVAILAQFLFGKIKNPHNLKKQVTNEQN